MKALFELNLSYLVKEFYKKLDKTRRKLFVFTCFQHFSSVRFLPTQDELLYAGQCTKGGYNHIEG